jgi:hypothetical protein
METGMTQGSDQHPIRQIEERDSYIIAESLAIAVALIDRLDDADRPDSDYAQMKNLLDRMIGDVRALEMIMGAARRLVELGLRKGRR